MPAEIWSREMRTTGLLPDDIELEVMDTGALRLTIDEWADRDRATTFLMIPDIKRLHGFLSEAMDHLGIPR